MSGGSGIAPLAAGARVRLTPGVSRVHRNGSVLLLAPEGSSVMVSPLVDEIWDLLVAGVAVGELDRELRERRPHARDVSSKLETFLTRLGDAGLLEGHDPPTRPPRRRIEIPIDAVARRVACLLRRVPRPLLAALVVACAAVATAGLILLLAGSQHPRVSELSEHLSLPGAFAVVMLISLHELGHAVACRLEGVAAGPAGIRVGRLGIPRPYVHTPFAAGIADPHRRSVIPAGGPLVDLLLGGAAAWTLIAVDPAGAAGSVVWVIVLYAYIAIDVGTSPLPVGDGSHLLEALLDDDFARGAALFGRHSRFVRRRSVRIYRAVCLAHVICTIALIYALL